MAKNYYIILGVDRGANAGQIKHAYRRIAKQLHPDRFCPSSDPEKFIEAKEAYDTLTDVERRRRYDDELRRQETALRMSRIPAIVRDRRRWYREFEQRESLVDEFFEGWVPGIAASFSAASARSTAAAQASRQRSRAAPRSAAS